MIAIIWRYEVKEEFIDEFVEEYGASGQWARLFGKADGFLGVRLLKGEDGCFLTIDEWRSERDFNTFMSLHRDEYEALDRRTEGWTREELRIGQFHSLQ